MSIAVAPPVDSLTDLSDVSAPSLAAGRVLTWDGGALAGASRLTWDDANSLLSLRNSKYPFNYLRLYGLEGGASMWRMDANPEAWQTGQPGTFYLEMNGTIATGGILTNSFSLTSQGQQVLRFVENLQYDFGQVGPGFALSGWNIGCAFGAIGGDGRLFSTVGYQIRSGHTDKPTLEVQTLAGQTQPTATFKDGAGVPFATLSPSGLQMYDASGNPTALVTRDGRVYAPQGLAVGNSAAASTLGTVTRKVEIFDASGASLGFVPVYDSIS